MTQKNIIVSYKKQKMVFTPKEYLALKRDYMNLWKAIYS